MDEVLFRSSQKIENLQVRTEIVVTKIKDVLVIYVQAGKSLLAKVWDRIPLSHIKDSWNEGATKLVMLVKDTKMKIIQAVDFKGFYYTLLNIFSKKWTKRDVCFGCSGLVIGIIVGVVIGISIKKKEQIVRYMQAVQCSTYLGIESASVVEDALAPNDCGDYDILVNVKAASVQLIDVEICSGYGRTLRQVLGNIHKKINQPIILGRECSGVIVDVGKRVARLEVGEEVWLIVPFWDQGTLCQTVLVHENRVSRKPKNIGFEAASSLPYAGSWALATLNEAGIDSTNANAKKILVHGGCSPVGCVLIQLLIQWKAEVTATCYKRAVPVAKALGASDVIVLSEPLIVNDIIHKGQERRESENDLVNQLDLKEDIFDVIIITNKDCVQMKELQKFLNPTGSVYFTLPPALISDSFGFIPKFCFRLYISIKFLLQNLIGLPQTNFDETHLCHASLDLLTEFVEHGQLQTVVDKIYHPHDIEMALHHIQSAQAIGSTVITFR